MRITSHGAAGEVTGSCHLLEVGRKRILVDCGLFQGNEGDYTRNAAPFAFDPRSIDAVVVTHCHLDHIGRLPLLAKAGYVGPIYATQEAREIGRLILMDAAHVMLEEYLGRKRKAARQGREVEPPPYGVDDVMMTVDLFQRPVTYGSPVSLGDGVSFTLRNAGHILGSAFVEIEEKRGGGRTIATMSGDLGYRGRAVMPDPVAPSECDFIAVESTYGDRPHRPVAESRDEFANAVKEALASGGNVIIPSFALERSQDVLYYLHEMWEAGDLPSDVRIYLDSPLAIGITRAYERHLKALNPKLVAGLDRGEEPFEFPGVQFTSTAEESRAINRFESGSIIIAGSGMVNGGRVLHHLRHNLWRPNCSVIFVGYQARGTLGRLIVDGANMVRIFGEEIAVRASVHTINGLSAHADRQGIVDWLRGSGKAHVHLIHGEPNALETLAAAVRSELGREVTIAEPLVPYEIRPVE